MSDMTDLDRISAQMEQLAELLTDLAKSWQRPETVEGAPPGQRLPSATEFTQLEIDAITSSIRAMRRRESTGCEDKVETLHYDVATRTAVDLATGILMEQHGVDADAALAILERLTDRITVEAVAEGVVRVQTQEIPDDAQRDAEPVSVAEPSRAIDAEPAKPLTP
jgi:ANTAR domain